MAERLRLPLPLALLLENVRSGGASNVEVLAALEQGVFDRLRPHLIDPDMDLEERAVLAKELQVPWSDVMRDGYAIGFFHANGMKKWLHFRYGLKADQDYVQSGLVFQAVPLTAEQRVEVEATAGLQWRVTATDDGKCRLQHRSEAE